MKARFAGGMLILAAGAWLPGVGLVAATAAIPAKTRSTGTVVSTVARAPHVAVFEQLGFPFYNVSPLLSPRAIAASLRASGVRAELLDARALSSPAQFNSRRFAALVMPYGNAFPQSAFANLRGFHRAGGSLILSGVPFTHPTAQLGAQGWTASPNWSPATRIVPQSNHGKAALELTGPTTDWVGVSSPRQPIKPNQTVGVAAWVLHLSGIDRGGDVVYVRFFNRSGSFISQGGAKISAGPGWLRVSATLKAPANAAAFDIAPQVHSPARTVRIDDISAQLDGRAVNLDNAGFEIAGNEWSDLGHSGGAALFGANGIGVGGFADQPPAPLKIAPGDLLKLSDLTRSWPQDAGLQVLDAASLPSYVELKPILLEGQKPVSALLIHRGGPFKGAVDAWTNLPRVQDLEAYNSEQVLARATLAALAEKKLVSPSRLQSAFAILSKLARPRVYADIRLPERRRPYPTFQPKMPPPARHLRVADIRDLPPEQQVLLVSLQGIVNRTQPRIYFILSDDDPFWLEEMQKQGHTGSPITIKDPLSLVSTFRSSIKGAVVPDPKIYLSPNIAATIAGLDDLVMATPELAARLKLPIKQDLRGRFKSNADGLRFVRTALLPRVNPYLSICLDPPMLRNGAMDQIIAARGLAFWITGPKQQGLPGADTAAEMTEVKEIFARLPLNSVVRGFWWHGDGQGLAEDQGVSLGSRFGKVTIVSDYIRNLSVLSGVPLLSLKQKPLAPAPRFDPSKVYIAFTMSDGDNLSTWPGYFRKYFQDPLHGTIPIGWGMAPGLLDVAPTMAQWFYNRATPNDEFICDVSGVGYIYPPDWATALHDREGALRSFYTWTGRAMQRMDMRTVRLMNVRTPDIPKVGALLPKVPFLVPDYGWSGPQKYSEFTYTLPTGQPVFRAVLEGQGQSPQEKADRLRQRVGSTRPAFLNAFIWNWGSKLSDLKQMLDILGPEYVAVTPSQLSSLYRQAQASGHINTNAPVASTSRPDNTPPPGFGALFNGRDLSGWQGLVSDPPARAKMTALELSDMTRLSTEEAQKHWKVIDGAITYDGQNNNLCTTRDYGDFEMLLDWKIEPGGDSGLYLRGSPQIQIWDNPIGSGGIYNNQKYPSNPLVKADKPPGQWNHFRILMIGDKVTVYLNGILVTDKVTMENYWERDKPIYARGPIELQHHGAPLYFKNIYIREIGP